MTLDRVNHRMFVPEPGNIRILVYQLDERGRHVRHTADYVIGHRSLLGRRRNNLPNRTDATGSPRTGLAFDGPHQRLFVRDGPRILVFDMRPDRMRDYPEATHVIGQPDFQTRVSSSGRRGFGRGGAVIIDEEHQRLFVQDGERVLVFDVHPGRLENFPEARLVIGQPDFESRGPGIGPERMGRLNGLAFDPELQRLFAADAGNHRVLVFDVHPDRLRNGPRAVEVLGQADFHSREARFRGATVPPEERAAVDRITAGGLDYDWVHERLFVSQLVDNRVLVFDASPQRWVRDPRALAVLGQPDMNTMEPRISRTRFAFPKDPAVDSEKQLLYVSEGFPGGNRVVAFDIRPQVIRDGAPAVDVVGHIDDTGRDDFESRVANDRLDGRTTTLARAVALDPVDHRLWVADEYNSRVLGFQLDRSNRLFDRRARWVFGQKDFHTAEVTRSRTGMAIPLALAYDKVDKRLYVGDGWNDRVLIYAADPATLEPGGNQQALYVLGQPDFETQDPRPLRNRFNFAVDLGRGIASSMLPVGIAFDDERRRAFISDGGHHRILVFDIHRDRLRSGAGAVAVLGQPDFTSSRPSLSASGLSSPGHLAYDPDNDRLFAVDNENHRVLVYDVAPARLRNGMEAGYVIGQPDFDTTERPRRRFAAINVMETEAIGPRRFFYPNGVAYDRAEKHLYLSDKGHDRVMVFDAAPERMRNFPYALAVLGQRSEESHSPQIEADRSGQDQIYDPRGLAFDSENQQLYVTDSHWARLLLFNMPQASRRVEIPAGGIQMFSSLDPFVVLDRWQEKRGAARVQASEGLGAYLLLTRTRFVIDELTEQQSRHLISHSAARVDPPGRRRLIWVGGDADTRIFLASSAPGANVVRLTLRGAAGAPLSSASRTLEAGESLMSRLGDLLPASGETLEVVADDPVSALAWSVRRNRHGEEVATALPVFGKATRQKHQAAANLPWGGGYASEIVLVNDSPEPSRGTVQLRGSGGEPVESRAFDLAPAEVWRWKLPGEGAIPRSGYATVESSSDPPLLFSLIRRSQRGLITETTAGAASVVRYAHLAFNTMPDMIRHGRRSRLQIVIANPGRLGASVRFVLKDLDGREVDRHEQLIRPRSQQNFLLSDLFNLSQFAGSIYLASDVGVAVSARQRTTSLRGEEILTELPLFAPGDGSSQDLMFPYLDLEGESVQIFLINTGASEIRSQLNFLTAEGGPLKTIVR